MKKNIYAYIRVSTQEQNTERQENEVLIYANKHSLGKVDILKEKISSRKELKERKLFDLLEKLKENDILLVSELSRLARNMQELNLIISKVIEKKANIKIISANSLIKEITSKDNSLNSLLVQVLSFASELERDMISERIKSSIASRKAKGLPVGRLQGYSILKGREKELIKYTDLGLNKSSIAKLMGISRGALYGFIKSAYWKEYNKAK